jgi:hypothetical protein
MKSTLLSLVAGLAAVTLPLHAEEAAKTSPSIENCPPEAEPILTVDAEAGQINLERGTLTVSVHGQYIGDRIEPEVNFDLVIHNDCKYEYSPNECGFVANVNGYSRVDGLVDALAQAEQSLADRRTFERSFGLDDKGCCRDLYAFRGRVAVDAKASTLAFSFGSSDPVELTPRQAAQLRRYVVVARDVIAHLKPQFDAFNAVAPDASIPVELGPRITGVRCRAASDVSSSDDGGP